MIPTVARPDAIAQNYLVHQSCALPCRKILATTSTSCSDRTVMTYFPRCMHVCVIQPILLGSVLTLRVLIYEEYRGNIMKENFASKRNCRPPLGQHVPSVKDNGTHTKTGRRCRLKKPIHNWHLHTHCDSKEGSTKPLLTNNKMRHKPNTGIKPQNTLLFSITSTNSKMFKKMHRPLQ